MNPAEARALDPSRYPPQLTEAGYMEPCPRRIRAVLDGRTVLDSQGACYVWENPYHPWYFLPVADVDPAVVDLPDTETFETGPFGGLVHVAWDSVDAWFEEDQQVLGGHPRSPYSRVDAIRSARLVRVEIDGVVLAESGSPVFLFETGLPTRRYLPRTDVDFTKLERTDRVAHCPYKGTTSDYWSARVGETVHADIAWSYAHPTDQVLQIAGLIAFYDEKVDMFIDDLPLSRPKSKFS